MRVGLIAAVALLATTSLVQAQSTSYMLDGSGNVLPYIRFGSDNTLTGCDSNDKTPAESVECKLAYWQKKVVDLKKERDALDEKLTKAQERVQAFGDAKRH